MERPASAPFDFASFAVHVKDLRPCFHDDDRLLLLLLSR